MPKNLQVNCYNIQIKYTKEIFTFMINDRNRIYRSGNKAINMGKLADIIELFSMVLSGATL
jgi:hypothetical protein